MRWKTGRRSQNVQDRRRAGGSRRGGGSPMVVGGGGIGMLVFEQFLSLLSLQIQKSLGTAYFLKNSADAMWSHS